MGSAAAEHVDGRHARRERGRAAVIDAMFELLQEGHVPPPVELVASRAGVSTASVFRYFDGLDDLQRQSFVRFRERFGHLYDIPDCGTGPLRGRVRAFVEARLALYEAVAPMLSIARARAIEHDPAAEAVAANRAMLAEQVRGQFAPELRGMTRSVRADRVAAIDALTSPEAREILQRAHGRSRRRMAAIWAAGVEAALSSEDREDRA